jgi:hypothetical protein
MKPSASAMCRAPPTSSGLSTTGRTARWICQPGGQSPPGARHPRHDGGSPPVVGALNRPNVFIKVPATAEGLPAIQQLISEGINVNVTLLFGLPRYRQVAEAYIAGIEARAAQGKPVKHVASVASFFVSRIDALVDPLLENSSQQGGKEADLAKRARGQVAIASAKMAYQIYKEIFGSDRFRSWRRRALVPAAALGQHRHQEPGLQRREIRRGPHRTGHGQHGPARNPRRLPRPWRAESPARRRCQGSPLGVGATAGTRASASTM